MSTSLKAQEEIVNPAQREIFDLELLQIQEEFDWLLDRKISLHDFLFTEELHNQYLNKEQHENLLEYYKENGEFVDLLELQSIDGFDYLLYIELKNIIKTKDVMLKNTKKNYQIKGRYRSKSINDLNLVSNNIYQERYLINNSNNFSLGINRQIDIEDQQHISSFIQFKYKSQQFMYGNMEMFYGQGLLFGMGYSNAGILGFTGISAYNNSLRAIANNNINSLKGIGYSLKMKNINSNVALINNKNLITELKLTSKKYQHGILIFKNFDKIKFSTYNERRFNNIVVYSEIAYSDDIAFSTGILALFSNAQQMSITYTSFSSKYESVYAAQKVLGINNNQEKGLRIGYTQELNFKNKIDFRLIHRQTTKYLGIKDLYNLSTRIDIIWTRNKGMSTIYFSYLDALNNRFKYRRRIDFNENWYVNLQLNLSTINRDYSYSNGMNLNYKNKNLKASNAFSIFNISKSNPIYYNENTSAGSLMAAVHRSGYLNDLGINISLRNGLRFRIHYQSIYVFESKNIEHRFFLQFEIRC